VFILLKRYEKHIIPVCIFRDNECRYEIQEQKVPVWYTGIYLLISSTDIENTFWFENLAGWDDLEDVGGGERIVLKES
jgi:hypothetical protein